VVTVREVEPADHAFLRGFSCSGPPYSRWTKRVQKIIRGSLTDALADPERDITAYVAIDDDGKLVGVVGLEPAADDPKVWLIDVVGVVATSRKQGIGLELFDTALGHCRDLQAESVTIEVHRSNIPGQQLAKKVKAILFDHPQDPQYFQGAINLTDEESG
jgi:GNAT superfamily N-acetyltransferase